jgi:hypothetical protein
MVTCDEFYGSECSGSILDQLFAASSKAYVNDLLLSWSDGLSLSIWESFSGFDEFSSYCCCNDAHSRIKTSNEMFTLVKEQYSGLRLGFVLLCSLAM